MTKASKKYTYRMCRQFIVICICSPVRNNDAAFLNLKSGEFQLFNRISSIYRYVLGQLVHKNIFLLQNACPNKRSTPRCIWLKNGFIKKICVSFPKKMKCTDVATESRKIRTKVMFSLVQYGVTAIFRSVQYSYQNLSHVS